MSQQPGVRARLHGVALFVAEQAGRQITRVPGLAGAACAVAAAWDGIGRPAGLAAAAAFLLLLDRRTP